MQDGWHTEPPSQGEACLAISVEDVEGRLCCRRDDYQSCNRRRRNSQNHEHGQADGPSRSHDGQTYEELGKEFGVIVVAEGLAEYLPYSYLEGIPRDDHGHIAISQINLCQIPDKTVKCCLPSRDRQNSQNQRITTRIQARCTQPTAFDVMLGSQLGVGAFRALVEEGLNGVMVSVKNQFDLRYVPFEELVDPENLVTMVRYIKTDSDFHQLARYLEQDID